MRRFTALDAESRKAAVGLPRSYDKALKHWLRTTVNKFSAVGSSTADICRVKIISYTLTLR